jgi:hypothetical protein
LLVGQHFVKVFEGKTRPFTGAPNDGSLSLGWFGWQLTQQQRIAHCKLGAYIGGHARGKFCGTVCVERDRQHSAKDAAVKGRDPFRAVLCPKQNTVARTDASLSEQRSELPRQSRNLPITGCTPPDALEADNGNLAVKAAEVVEQCSQMVSHQYSGKFMVSPQACGLRRKVAINSDFHCGESVSLKALACPVFAVADTHTPS